MIDVFYHGPGLLAFMAKLPDLHTKIVELYEAPDQPHSQPSGHTTGDIHEPGRIIPVAKMLCKGTRKDGTPCQGVALEQYDGYCLAHGAPPEQAHEWRSKGGKNSATAVRRDKRMPEHLKEPIDHIVDYMRRLAEKDPTPAGLNALSRAAKTLIELRRFANEEMDLIRAEEIRAEAAARLDVQTDLEVLEAADDIRVMRDRLRRESLVDQGFARFMEPFMQDDPPEVILNEKGRLRFGFQYVEERQTCLKVVDAELTEYVRGESDLPDLPTLSAGLEEVQEDLEDTLTKLARVSEAPYDPMTGQPFTRLPDKVKIIAPRDSYCSTHENPQQALQEQLIYVKNLRRRVKEIIESENDKRRQVEREREAEKRTEREADAGNRSDLKAATEDRTVSETDPGNQEEQETGNGDGAKPDKAPGFQFVMIRDNRNLAEPEPDHQTD
ncbi:MAG: hypothetical protein F4Y42_03950 [Caldilineaceae bacterium SB0664_bin_27]|uniref:Uncharacterized protein n=1 Tax=Caldilineaceae bacterium SB0664_bin_27 TaxID=2605260 RepID=A0A6B0YNU4_9CHLR|nr:hypothetical protein [Caldilineaceae bacterium SB0664_bin_27]